MEIVFIVRDILGGVAYLNFDIINHLRPDIKPKIRVILAIKTNDNLPKFNDTILADTIDRFEYSTFENEYYVRKRLSKLIGNEPGIVVCNDYLELRTIWSEGTNKTVFNIVHDEYNFRLSKEFHQCIDFHLCHSKYNTDRILSEFGGKSILFQHGVLLQKIETFTPVTKNPRLCFIGRLVESKGVLLLKGINDELESMGIHPLWTLIGSGPLKEKLLKQWNSLNNIAFRSPDNKNEVFTLLKGSDFFIFPSNYEGYGIALIEAAAAGTIPIVRYINGGFNEVCQKLEIEIIDDESNIEKSFATKIIGYINNQKGVQKKQEVYKSAVTYYNIQKTADNFIQILLNNQLYYKKPIKMNAIFSSRLDKRYLPNFVVKSLRKLFA